MKKQIALFAVFALLFCSASFAMAEDMSYSRISVGYVDNEEEAGGISVDGDGFGISGSYEFNDNAFFSLSFASLEYDVTGTLLGFNINGSADRDMLTIGLGFHTPMSDNTDLVLTIGREKNDVSALGLDATVYNTLIGLGARSKVSDKTEVYGKAIYADGDGDSDTGFSVGGNYYIREKLSLEAFYTSIGDADTMAFGVTLDY